jgi:hypothetical protein
MLTIRDDQMRVLDEYALQDFFRRACAFLREFAREDLARLDDARLLAGVKATYETARQHGVVGEQGVMRWMCLHLMAGPKFYDLPGVDEALSSGRPVDDVLRDIYERLAVLETRRGRLA